MLNKKCKAKPKLSDLGTEELIKSAYRATLNAERPPLAAIIVLIYLGMESNRSSVTKIGARGIYANQSQGARQFFYGNVS
ncbi:hypothetical protein TNCV_3255481 [Trichonephila clavipes]|nr:hypothetical protein TNCV_3255481 [Trichonephila clavipes]